MSNKLLGVGLGALGTGALGAVGGGLLGAPIGLLSELMEKDPDFARGLYHGLLYGGLGGGVYGGLAGGIGGYGGGTFLDAAQKASRQLKQQTEKQGFDYRTPIYSGGAGAGIGGLIGLLREMAQEKEEKEYLESTLKGALIGGGTGAVAGTAGNLMLDRIGANVADTFSNIRDAAENLKE
jgi:hypothetical protein